MASTPAQFLAKTRKLTHAVPDATKKGVEAAALLVKTTIQAQPGYAARLRGVGRNGSKLNVRYTMKGVGNPTALLKATGPFHLLERDTSPHRIEPKSRRGKGKKAIVVQGQPVAGANHPGTKGKHPFEHGVNKASPVVPDVIKRTVMRELGRVFT